MKAWKAILAACLAIHGACEDNGKSSGMDASLLPNLGFNVGTDTLSTAQRRETFARISSMGANWVRSGVPWYLVQPESPNDTNDTAINAFGEVINDAAAQGLHMLILGDQAPDWARGGYGTANNSTAYGDYMRTLAETYQGTGPDGSSPAFEIMNEPNDWASPVDYAHAACAAYTAVKQVDSAAIVAVGSLDVSEWRDWLTNSLSAGLSECFDVISAHPYDGPDVLEPIQQVVAAHGRSNIPIWITEFGSSTCSDRSLYCVNPEKQATELTDYLEEIAVRYSSLVPVAMVYEATDDPTALGPPPERHFGIWDANLGAKPAVSALKKLYRDRSGPQASRAGSKGLQTTQAVLIWISTLLLAVL